MCVHIIHVLRVHAGISQGCFHAAGGTIAVCAGCSHVTCICAHAITYDFAVNFGSTLFGVLVFFKHQHTSTLTQNKTIAVLVPWATCCSRVIVAGGKCTHGSKTTDSQRRNSGFSTAGHHDICIAILDDTGGLSNGMCACGARGDHCNIRPFQTVHDGHVTRDHVDDATGYEKWGNPAIAFVDQIGVRVLDHWQTANARTNADPDSFGILFGDFQPRVFEGLNTRSQAIMDKSIHPRGFLTRNVFGDVKPFDLSGNFCSQGFCFKAGNA